MIILLVGLVLVVGVFFFTRSSGGGDEESFEAPPPAAQAPQTDSSSAGSDSGSTKSNSTSTGSSSDKSSTADSKAQDKSSTGEANKPAADKADPSGLPVSVQKAIDQKKVVVLLFWRPNSVDDRNVYKSVQGLRGRSKDVRVFTSGIGSVDRYVSIVGQGGVTQTPYLVVVNRDGQADTQVGYVDEKTIENTVYNAL